MGKKVYLIDNKRVYIEDKACEWYKDEQEELAECFKTGKHFLFKKVYKKTCPYCEDTFYTTTKTKLYDTDSCAAKYRRRSKKAANANVCAICGNTFFPIRFDAVCCSPACRQKLYRYRKKQYTPMH